MSSLFLTLLFVTNIGLGGAPAIHADTLSNWTTLNHINIARMMAGLYYYNGYLYLVGGAPSGENTIERTPILPGYNLGPWTISSSSTSFGLTTMVKGYIYIYRYGGALEYCSINSDGSAGPFIPTSASDTIRLGCKIVSYLSPSTGEAYVYLLGGIDDYGNPIYPSVLRSRVRPDGSLEGWVPDTPMSDPGLTVPSSIVYNNRIYTFGGANRMTNINPDGTLGQWTTLTISFPGIVSSALGINNNLYIFIDNAVYQASLDEQGQYTTYKLLISSPISRYLASTIAIGDYIYIIGGSQYVEDPEPHNIFWDMADRITVIHSTDIESDLWELYR